MKASEFAERLNGIQVQTDLLKKQEVSDPLIKEILKSYTVIPKGNNFKSDHPVLELVENYDCSNLQIGMVTLDERSVDTEDYIFFGKADVDDLAIYIVSGNVVMVEDGLDNILFYCAKDDGSFLDAILAVAVFLEKRTIDEGLYENIELNIQMAEEFGDIAGGELYYDFFKMMLGV